MSSTLTNYLRTHRRKAGFTQNETAFLIGLKSANRVSRYENLKRLPNLKTAFAYEVIFALPARELFAGIFEAVEKETVKRARELSKRFEKEHLNPALTRKIELLRTIASRESDQ